MDKKLEEIKASLKQNIIQYANEKQYEISFAEDSDEIKYIKYEQDYMMGMMRDLYNYINRVSEQMWQYQYEHNNGHLPAIKSADKMEKALEKLGLSNDYEVIKPIVYMRASQNRNGINIHVSANK